MAETWFRKTAGVVLMVFGSQLVPTDALTAAPREERLGERARQMLVAHPHFWAYAAAHGVDATASTAALAQTLTNFRSGPVTYEVELIPPDNAPLDGKLQLALSQVNDRLADQRVTVRIFWHRLVVFLPDEVMASLRGVMYAQAGGDPPPAQNTFSLAIAAVAASQFGIMVGITAMQGGVVAGQPIAVYAGVVIVSVSTGVMLLSMRIAANQTLKAMRLTLEPSERVMAGEEAIDGMYPMFDCFLPAGPNEKDPTFHNPARRIGTADWGYIQEARRSPLWTCRFTGEMKPAGN